MYSGTYIYIYIYMWLWITTRVVAGPPLCYKPFVAGPPLQTLVADLCVEYRSVQGACRGGVCRSTPLSVTNRCREMAAQACYKANVFNFLAYICYVYVNEHVYLIALCLMFMERTVDDGIKKSSPLCPCFHSSEGE